MRESNQLLREEAEKLSKSFSTLDTDLNDTKVVSEPTAQKSHGLEVDKTAIEAEKLILAREVEAWKDCVKIIVSRFHQVLAAQFLFWDDPILSSDKENHQKLSYVPSKSAVILDNQLYIAKHSTYKGINIEMVLKKQPSYSNYHLDIIRDYSTTIPILKVISSLTTHTT